MPFFKNFFTIKTGKSDIGTLMREISNIDEKTRLQMSNNDKLWDSIFNLLSELRKAIRDKGFSRQDVNKTPTIRLFIRCKKKLHVNDLKNLQVLLKKYYTPDLLVEQVCKECIAAFSARFPDVP